MQRGTRDVVLVPDLARRPAFPDMSWLGGNLNAVGLAITPIEARSKSVAGPSTPPIMGRCRDLRAGWRFSSVTAG